MSILFGTRELLICSFLNVVFVGFSGRFIKEVPVNESGHCPIISAILPNLPKRPWASQSSRTEPIDICLFLRSNSQSTIRVFPEVSNLQRKSRPLRSQAGEILKAMWHRVMLGVSTVVLMAFSNN
eukprot:GHVP01008393.1.p1 GENE.GHVP01008393.1~~GHVP01008393.1.p1  ORF type:complete len:125 (-),score=10.78 GHVP01008393.1:372-746(-)